MLLTQSDTHITKLVCPETELGSLCEIYISDLNAGQPQKEVNQMVYWYLKFLEEYEPIKAKMSSERIALSTIHCEFFALHGTFAIIRLNNTKNFPLVQGCYSNALTSHCPTYISTPAFSQFALVDIL